MIGISATRDENPQKRGRPPRSERPNKEYLEAVCFICLDGGSLVLCDQRGCPKAYHLSCIKRDESFLQAKATWTCGWHICNVCFKRAEYMCYTCTYSLCKGCTSDADYLLVRGDKGFCTTCMHTIMLIEKKEEGDNEMAHVDFDDKSCWEYLFKVYWLHLKENLSLNFAELCQARNLQKESCTVIGKGQVPFLYMGTNNIQRVTLDSTVVPQTNLYDHAEINIHNINMIYLRRNLMENLIEDKMFRENVVGSVVRIKIVGGGHKGDIYRLVKVVGTIKVPTPYKVGVKTTDVMLEVLNLDKKEVVSLDTISNRDLSEDECRHLKQSIECGHLKRFTVGEIQKTALALHSVTPINCLEAERRRLNHLYDQESKNGHPDIDSGYKFEEAERLDSQNKVYYIKGDVGHTGRRAFNFAIPSEKRNMYAPSSPTKEEGAVEIQQRLIEGRKAWKLRSLNKEAVGSSKLSTPVFSVRNTSDVYKHWHYIDPSGKIQGPFSMVQLQKWSTTGYFPPDMRIWAGDNQENSILLTEALKDQFHEVVSFPCDTSSQLREVGVTSDSELDMFDLRFTYNTGASRYSKQIDVHWHGDNARIQSSCKGQSLSSHGSNSWTSIRNTPVVSKCKTPLISCLQEQDSSTVFFVRENEKYSGNDLNQDVKRCKYGPYYENRTSSELTVSKSPVRQILGDHSSNQCLSLQSSEDTLNNTPTEASSCTLHLNSVLSLDFLNVAAQHGKLNITDVRSSSQHRGETNGNMESVLCSAHMDLGFPDFPKTSIGYPKELADKSQQSVPLITYHDSGPNWSSTSSITVNEWDFNPSSVSSVKPAEGLCDLVTTATSLDNKLAHYFETHSASYESTFQLSTEPNEFTTFPDEIKLNLWEEVDAMEAQQVLASPTIGTNNGGTQKPAANK
ncbi:zinc finger CCCH domain-containing protein 44-like [Apium graveolens]|uniref:zinc finger CCCH domain-containing protein 44-like n=2 Tax=Apium graveolens TaxID=4045 RepID=UPI003D78D64D